MTRVSVHGANAPGTEAEAGLGSLPTSNPTIVMLAKLNITVALYTSRTMV